MPKRRKTEKRFYPSSSSKTLSDCNPDEFRSTTTTSAFDDDLKELPKVLFNHMSRTVVTDKEDIEKIAGVSQISLNQKVANDEDIKAKDQELVIQEVNGSNEVVMKEINEKDNSNDNNQLNKTQSKAIEKEQSDCLNALTMKVELSDKIENNNELIQEVKEEAINSEKNKEEPNITEEILAVAQTQEEKADKEPIQEASNQGDIFKTEDPIQVSPINEDKIQDNPIKDVLTNSKLEENEEETIKEILKSNDGNEEPIIQGQFTEEQPEPYLTEPFLNNNINKEEPKAEDLMIIQANGEMKAMNEETIEIRSEKASREEEIKDNTNKEEGCDVQEIPHDKTIKEKSFIEESMKEEENKEPLDIIDSKNEVISTNEAIILNDNEIKPGPSVNEKELIEATATSLSTKENELNNKQIPEVIKSNHPTNSNNITTTEKNKPLHPHLKNNQVGIPIDRIDLDDEEQTDIITTRNSKQQKKENTKKPKELCAGCLIV